MDKHSRDYFDQCRQEVLQRAKAANGEEFSVADMTPSHKVEAAILIAGGTLEVISYSEQHGFVLKLIKCD